VLVQPTWILERREGALESLGRFGEVRCRWRTDGRWISVTEIPDSFVRNDG
jgi:hypothetical protein